MSAVGGEANLRATFAQRGWEKDLAFSLTDAKDSLLLGAAADKKRWRLFAHGVGSSLDIFGYAKPQSISYRVIRNDTRAIESDWCSVGRDIDHAAMLMRVPVRRMKQQQLFTEIHMAELRKVLAEALREGQEVHIKVDLEKIKVEEVEANGPAAPPVSARKRRTSRKRRPAT